MRCQYRIMRDSSPTVVAGMEEGNSICALVLMAIDVLVLLGAEMSRYVPFGSVVGRLPKACLFWEEEDIIPSCRSTVAEFGVQVTTIRGGRQL